MLSAGGPLYEKIPPKSIRRDFYGKKITYLTSTSAPASVSFVLIASASSLETPSLTVLGAPSTTSLASFRPRPVISRTTLIDDDDELEFFLGLCNSRLLNWFFAKLSTNSNVNGYEVDNLPIRIPSESKKQEIASLVHILLDDASDVSANDLLNSLVYEIYGLSPEQIEVVESSYI